jgi:endo-1,4-beta-xylanase
MLLLRASTLFAVASLAPAQIPAPLGVPKPAPSTDAPYAPQPILQGGIVIPLWAPDSPYLKKDKIREAEVYSMSQAVPGRISSIVGIHNPSIEVHTVERGINTGAAIILAAGGGHNSLNVGGESADFVPFFYNYGINTVILRNRLRRDGYNPQTDEVYDAQQAIRIGTRPRQGLEHRPQQNRHHGLFRRRRARLSQSSNRTAEGAAKNNDPADPLAGISSRPDFVGLIYPGPSPFARNRTAPAIPRNTPPAFVVCGGSGDRVHAVWAIEYFNAMLALSIPNIEMHIYGNGRHPGDRLPEGGSMSGGLTDRNGTPFGTWQYRFIEWFRDLGFLQKPGVETKAARDVAAFVSQPAR